jgi:TfoX/Sxy family transcriptional regulator of competence genes
MEIIMPYDQDIDSQMSLILGTNNIEMKKMFGGTCYLYKGKMICGVWKDNAIFKVKNEIAENAVQKGEVEYFNMQKRIMKGMVMINKTKLTKERLTKWIERAKRSMEEE